MSVACEPDGDAPRPSVPALTRALLSRCPGCWPERSVAECGSALTSGSQAAIRAAENHPLDRLRDGTATVAELQEALGSSQQNVSKHLGILHAAGMVSRTKQGNHTRYAISDPSVFELCDQVCGGIRRQLHELETILQPSDQAATAGG